MTEHDIQNAIRIELSRRGFCVFRVNTAKVKLEDGRWFDVGVPNGFPDLFAVKDGRIYFIEVKCGRNKPSEDQKKFIKTMQSRYGCRAGVAWSVEDALRIVDNTAEP